MRKTIYALAAAFAVLALPVMSVTAEAGRVGGGGMGGFSGGGVRMAPMGGGGARMGNFGGGPRIGNFGGGGRIGNFNRGPRVGNFNRGPRVGNFNRGPRFGANKGWKGGKWAGGHRHGRNHRHHRRYYPYYGAVPLYYGAYYSNYYGDDCGWLRRKAIRTGSSYWWRRYDECRYDSY